MDDDAQPDDYTSGDGNRQRNTGSKRSAIGDEHSAFDRYSDKAAVGNGDPLADGDN
ncbi:MAG: hypothetical protein AB7R40_22425 [Nitrospiraceae bacterium]